LLERGARDAGSLARATGTHEESLHRLLRALSAVGVFDQRGRRFALTPLSRLLRSETPDSMRSVAALAGASWRRAAFGLLYSVRTGRSAFEREFGQSFYAYLSTHQSEGRLFADVMAYNWRTMGRAILDVGGGSGAMLETILRRHPGVRGILVETPAMAAEARRRFRESRLTARCTVTGSGFFRPLPEGGSAYVLAFVLHNWDDKRASAILRGCRRAMGPRGRILVIESLLRRQSPFAAVHDLEMLLYMRGGKERSLAEYRRLLERAGLAVRRVIHTTTTASLLEARAV
jgi:ubiquinone/menaquinone biosynthesis C-methylase UbiE